MIETCQSYLKVEEKKETKTETQIEEAGDATSPPTTNHPVKSILKPTPGPLIPGPLIDIPFASTPKPEGAVVGDSNVPVESAISPATLVEIRRTRARGLLEILGASS